MTDEPEVRTGPVLAIFAHPDDAEICAGGLLSTWAAAGRAVHLLVLTNGDRGSSDPGMPMPIGRPVVVPVSRSSRATISAIDRRQAS